MTDTEWVHVGADPVTIESAAEISKDVSGEGLRFTRQQVLRRALALGVEAIKADPSLLSPARSRKVS